MHEKKNEMWLNKASSRTLTVFVGVKWTIKKYLQRKYELEKINAALIGPQQLHVSALILTGWEWDGLTLNWVTWVHWHSTNVVCVALHF